MTMIELPKLTIETIEIEVVGDSPLISHAWSQKARLAMAQKQQKKAAKGREPKDPWGDFVSGLYWMEGAPEGVVTEAQIEAGRYGFPSVAFKAAAVDACTSVAGMTKIAARQAFHVEGELTEILGPPPSMREDMARVGMGTADIRYRPEFSPWGAVLTVKVNTMAVSLEQVTGLFDIAGFAVGIGDWRPARGGPYGRFHVRKGGEEVPGR